MNQKSAEMQDKKKIAIVGSRQYPRLDLVKNFVISLNPLQHIVISGGAIGVDQVAEETARSIGIQTEIYKADWNQYGKSAGAIRNRTIVERADEVYAYWDEKSKGTLISINISRELNKKLFVFGRNGILITPYMEY